VAPRRLVIETRPDGAGARLAADDVETVCVADCDAALAELGAGRYDELVVDLGLPPLDGWCLLSTVGARRVRPRLVALVADAAEGARARRLGADSCVIAGTSAGARALGCANKEKPWRVPRTTTSPRPTTAGASV